MKKNNILFLDFDIQDLVLKTNFKRNIINKFHLLKKITTVFLFERTIFIEADYIIWGKNPFLNLIYAYYLSLNKKDFIIINEVKNDVWCYDLINNPIFQQELCNILDINKENHEYYISFLKQYFSNLDDKVNIINSHNFSLRNEKYNNEFILQSTDQIFEEIKIPKQKSLFNDINIMIKEKILNQIKFSKANRIFVKTKKIILTADNYGAFKQNINNTLEYNHKENILLTGNAISFPDNFEKYISQSMNVITKHKIVENFIK